MSCFHIVQVPVLMLDYLHGFVHGGENLAADLFGTLDYIVTNGANISDDVVPEPVERTLKPSANSGRDSIVGLGVSHDVRPSRDCLRVPLHVATSTRNAHGKAGGLR
jgi:hypothetical protein